MSDNSNIRDEDLRNAAAEGNLTEVKRLLAAGASPNAFGEFGLSALHWAAKGEHFETVKTRLTAGADINGRDETVFGNMPLGDITARCSLEMAKLLLDHGADPTIKGWMQLNAIDRARERKDAEGARVLDLLRKASEIPGLQR